MFQSLSSSCGSACVGHQCTASFPGCCCSRKDVFWTFLSIPWVVHGLLTGYQPFCWACWWNPRHPWSHGQVLCRFPAWQKGLGKNEVNAWCTAGLYPLSCAVDPDHNPLLTGACKCNTNIFNLTWPYHLAYYPCPGIFAENMGEYGCNASIQKGPWSN